MRRISVYTLNERVCVGVSLRCDFKNANLNNFIIALQIRHSMRIILSSNTDYGGGGGIDDKLSFGDIQIQKIIRSYNVILKCLE